MRVGRLSSIPLADYEAHYNCEHERDKSRRRTVEWTVPKLRSLGVLSGRLLSIGCGNGVDVVTLRDFGYEAFGCEFHACLPEAEPWVTKLVSGSLPFADSEFDAAIALEVIEHVGLDVPNGRDLRQARLLFAREVLRVVKPNGVLLIATPNRYFPADEHGDPIRIHSPVSDETLTVAELKVLFGNDFRYLSAEGYFAFGRFERVCGKAFGMISRPLLKLATSRVFHNSPMNPHLFMAFRHQGSMGQRNR